MNLALPSQLLDAVDTDGTDDGACGAIQPPVAPSSDIIKVDSNIDVRALVRCAVMQRVRSRSLPVFAPSSCSA